MVSLSVSLSISLSSASVWLSFCPFVCPFVCLSLSVCISPFFQTHTHRYILSFYLFFFPYLLTAKIKSHTGTRRPGWLCRCLSVFFSLSIAHTHPTFLCLSLRQLTARIKIRTETCRSLWLCRCLSAFLSLSHTHSHTLSLSLSPPTYSQNKVSHWNS